MEAYPIPTQEVLDVATKLVDEFFAIYRCLNSFTLIEIISLSFILTRARQFLITLRVMALLSVKPITQMLTINRAELNTNLTGTYTFLNSAWHIIPVNS